MPRRDALTLFNIIIFSEACHITLLLRILHFAFHMLFSTDHKMIAL